MSWFYLVLKFIHILSAIVAVGSNITYGLWNARIRTAPEHSAFTLKSLKFLDDRIANPAYGVLLLTGLIMVFVGHWAFASLWIIGALVLFIVVLVLGVGLFTPVLRGQITLAEAGDTSSPEFARLARRSAILGPIVGIAVILILALMVFKPTL
jgi:uncharacterized membrane protein